jgi:hypothetical protein
MPPSAAVGKPTRPPKWIKPQLTRLVDEAPTGGGWVHEIKYDGYRMHARIDGGDDPGSARAAGEVSLSRRRAVRAQWRRRAGVQPPAGGDG